MAATDRPRLIAATGVELAGSCVLLFGWSLNRVADAPHRVPRRKVELIGAAIGPTGADGLIVVGRFAEPEGFPLVGGSNSVWALGNRDRGAVPCLSQRNEVPETAACKARPGFVVAGFRNPFVADGEHDEDAGPPLVYINIWCTDNAAGRESGVSYCEVQWHVSRFMVSIERDEEEADLSNALEQYMTEPEPKKSKTEAVPDTHAASEPTLSCEPGLVPAADAGSQDAALGFLKADTDSEEEPKSSQPLEQTVVTPLLSADAVVELMADTAPDDIIWQAEKIRQGIKLVFPEVDDSTVQDEDLVEITKSEQVVCASGESDRESIRDFDSGTGRFRWNRRSPYWFKRELCADEDEQGMKYRRRMKPAVAGSSLVWKPEYPDNEDGSNEQPSFALSAQIGTDEAGRITGYHKDVQPNSYAGQSEDLWQQMWGTRFTDSNTNSMLALTDKYRVVRKIEAITDDQVDEKLLDEILDDVQGIAVIQGVPQALEELFLLLKGNA